MNPTTTQHLGQRPGRARLGAFGRVARRGTTTTCTRAWRGGAGVGRITAATCDRAIPAYPVFDATPIETLANSGTAHATGLNSMKRTARHLGTRST